ncbi:MAG: hypothetical protein ABI623_01510, partial [bacterium]
MKQFLVMFAIAGAGFLLGSGSASAQAQSNNLFVATTMKAAMPEGGRAAERDSLMELYHEQVTKKTNLCVGLTTDLAFARQRCVYLTGMKLYYMFTQKDSGFAGATVIAEGVKVEGNFKGEGPMVIDGEVKEIDFPEPIGFI